MCCLTNLLLFDVPLLYYYINLKSSIIFCLSSGDLYLCLGISLSCSVVTVSELFYRKFFKSFVILSAILLPKKSPVASSYFWIGLFECIFECIFLSFKCICSRLFGMIKTFLAVFTTHVFTYIFTNIFTHIFSKRQKSVAL